MTISPQTLTMAVLAVDGAIKRIQMRMPVAVDPEVSCLEEDLLAYSKAQMELKRLYVAQQQSSDNLPPYEELFE